MKPLKEQGLWGRTKLGIIEMLGGCDNHHYLDLVRCTNDQIANHTFLLAQAMQIVESNDIEGEEARSITEAYERLKA